MGARWNLPLADGTQQRGSVTVVSVVIVRIWGCDTTKRAGAARKPLHAATVRRVALPQDPAQTPAEQHGREFIVKATHATASAASSSFIADPSMPGLLIAFVLPDLVQNNFAVRIGKM